MPNKKKPKSHKKPTPVEVERVEVAYTISDPIFGDFSPQVSANAWWMERNKLQNLVNAFKYDCTYEEACISAGILLHNLKYFLSIHPEFYTVIEACRQVPNLKARQRVVTQLDRDTATARWWLEKKLKKEFGDAGKGPSIVFNLGAHAASERGEFA